MKSSSVRTIVGLLTVGFICCAFALATPGGSNPVCYVETWFDVTQTEEGNCATYADCPGRVLCAVGTVDKNFSTITFGPYPCDDFSGGIMGPGGICTGGTPIVPSTTTTMIDQQSCSGGC